MYYFLNPKLLSLSWSCWLLESKWPGSGTATVDLKTQESSSGSATSSVLTHHCITTTQLQLLIEYLFHNGCTAISSPKSHPWHCSTSCSQPPYNRWRRTCTQLLISIVFSEPAVRHPFLFLTSRTSAFTVACRPQQGNICRTWKCNVHMPTLHISLMGQALVSNLLIVWAEVIDYSLLVSTEGPARSHFSHDGSNLRGNCTNAKRNPSTGHQLGSSKCIFILLTSRWHHSTAP